MNLGGGLGILFAPTLLKFLTMNKPRDYSKDSYHHIYNKGVLIDPIFQDEIDYHYFLEKTHKYKTKYKISILCYCLMPTHFHLFVKQLTEHLSIGKFTSDLLNSYTKTYNKRYKRTGVLFQGKTKNKKITSGKYYFDVFYYIHMNPVRAGLVTKSIDW
jgi:putative transposase